MPDYDRMLDMLTRAGIMFNTDWNREILLGSETRVVKWISVTNKEDGVELRVDFKFNISGGLESVSPLTNE